MRASDLYPALDEADRRIRGRTGFDFRKGIVSKRKIPLADGRTFVLVEFRVSKAIEIARADDLFGEASQ